LRVYEGGHSIADFIANASHLVERAALRIRQGPVVTFQARHKWACVTAPHRHQERCAASEFISQFPWSVRVEIDPDFPHDLHDFGVDPIAWFSARGDGLGTRWIRHRPKEGRCHLRSAGIVDTGKDHAVHYGLDRS
jgi:hypothetical protein